MISRNSSWTNARIASFGTNASAITQEFELEPVEYASALSSLNVMGHQGSRPSREVTEQFKMCHLPTEFACDRREHGSLEITPHD